MIKKILKRPAIKTYQKILRFKNRLHNFYSIPVNVLIYHRVANLTSDPQMLAVTPENFYNQLRYLKEKYDILRFEQDWTCLKKKSIVITFDDGYEDNYTDVLPIIEDLKIPVTIFVSTGNIDSDRENWWDELERIILKTENLPEEFILGDSILNKRWSVKNSLDRNVLYKDMHHLLLKQSNYENRDIIVKHLRNWAGVEEKGRLTHRTMDKNQLISLSQSKFVTIGAHTHRHFSLATLSLQEQIKEINISKTILEELVKKRINVFSYPFGSKCDYTQETVNILKNNGFTKAASNFPGLWHNNGNNFEIPRNLVRNWKMDVFIKQIRGYWLV